MKREYERKDAELDSEMVIEFESDEIKVDVPLDDTSVKGGWKIAPNTPPIVCHQYYCMMMVLCIIILLLSYTMS